MAEKIRQPSAARQYEVSDKELPLHCPLDSMLLWNLHPRVYLPIGVTGRSKCPYCGTEYVLRND